MKISKITRKDKLFESSGYSKLKVTKKGKAQILEIPIKSSGVQDLIDEFTRKVPPPKAPRIRQYIRPNSMEAKQSGLSGFQWVYDLTDEKYKKALDEYNMKLGWKVILAGLDLEIEGETDEEKIKTLQEAGITDNHIKQLVEDIQNLTKIENEELEEDIKNDLDTKKTRI